MNALAWHALCLVPRNLDDLFSRSDIDERKSGTPLLWLPILWMLPNSEPLTDASFAIGPS